MRCLKTRRRWLPVFAVIVLASSQVIQAAEHVWVIGGGPDVYGAGLHIEHNVNWVLDVLRKAPGERELHVYFGAGNSDNKDVVEWSAPAEGPEQLQALARVYGDHVHNGESYRQSQVAEITGSTRRDELMQSLKLDFSQLGPGDRAFIVYNGHGLRSLHDAGDNTLRLWDDSQISAREFESLLSEIEPSVPTRFLFPQCYSGGFSRLVHPGGDDVMALAASSRCGFMASSERRQSEGCSSSTKLGDYRDYTTHFFAAFSGTTRQGDAVTENIDFDDDGTITMFDAHLFALTRGYARSMPRSTSETFLERWQPWYLRWMGTGTEPDNLYGRLAQELARNLQLQETGPALLAELRRRRADLQIQKVALDDERIQNQHRIEQLQNEIQLALRTKWPAVRYPYTKNFLQFLTSSLHDAQAFIVQHSGYARLVELQDRQLAIDTSVLRLERDTTELDKISRLRKLARLREQFDDHANSDDRDAYQRLMACETSTL